MPVSDIGRAIQRGLFLNLPRLQRDGCDIETEVHGHLHRIEFGGIEPPRDSFERTTQRVGSRAGAGTAKAPTGAGIRNPHEVPSGLADHGIEHQRRKILDPGPVAAHGLPQRIQTVGKHTAVAQKNRMQLQACPRFAPATRTGFKPVEAACPDDSCAAGTASARTNSSLEKPVASATLGTGCRTLPLRS